MPYIHLAALAGLLLFAFCSARTVSYDAKNGQRLLSAKAAAALVFGAALAVRFFSAGLSEGFGTDTACFASWADRIYSVGPGGFYAGDVFTDYPPGYMYLLYPVGAVRSLLHLRYFSVPHLILLRLPAILCDLALGLLLYREAQKRCGAAGSLALCAAYLFNPAVILNSSVWGQVDAVPALALIYMCLMLMKGRLIPAYISFFAALLIKPQALFLAPILLIGMIHHLLLQDFSLTRLLRSLAGGVSVMCGAILLCVPFGLDNVWKQYFSTISSYPYASVNAYNFWGLAGLNWVSQDRTFMGLPYYVYGSAAIVIAVAVTMYLGLKHHRDTDKYPLLCALLLVTVFVFSVRMHERYLYPAMAFLLLAYICRPSRRLFLCYGGFSLLHLYNTAHVLFFYNASDYNRYSPVIYIVSLGMLTMTCFLYQTVSRLQSGRETAALSAVSAAGIFSAWRTGRRLPEPTPSRRGKILSRSDVLFILIVTALYSCFALYDLGDRQAPATAYDMVGGQSLELYFTDRSPAKLSYYIAPWHSRTFALEGKYRPKDDWVSLGEITLENVFAWQDLTIESEVPCLRLTLMDSQASLMELVFLDRDGGAITPVNREDYAALFDEQDLRPDRGNFRNSTYFDEIYHARTAYEFLHGIPAYENTHPPLGKILIAAGVAVFGMNPFGWRIAGVIFGILMVPAVFLFAKRITSHSAAAGLACALFAFDFMHFTQTRIATIDVFITFFVILMYYFMYCYSTLSFYDTSLKRTLLPLGACGVCMGLGIACKWTGAYAGAGLAVIFFSVLYRRYREYLYAKSCPQGVSCGISHRKILDSFRRCTAVTLLFCVAFFVLVPALIYLLSYLPFRDNTQDGLFLRMLHNQVSMFRYHSTLVATHPYSSPWYQWPLIVRPIWYFSGIPGETVREGISAFGNPLVWWMGIPAFFYTLVLIIKKRDRTAAFLSVGYLAQYLPWIFVTRITFIYHYFPSVIFVVLMIVYSLLDIKKKKRLSERRFLLLLTLYGTAALGLFLLFYPVLSGQPVEASYVDRWLRWFDSWVLTVR